jgi:acyl-CoA synthetase (AMP-forming)/AMP-acid ligase II/acyl carrier protein
MQKQFRSISELLAEQAASHGEQIAVFSEWNDAISYQELDRLARELSMALSCPKISKLKKRIRPRIGIVLPNGVSIAIALLGVTLVAEAAPLNPCQTEAEYQDQFALLAIDALLVSESETGPAVAVALAMNIPVYRMTPEYSLCDAISNTSHFLESRPGEIAVVFMTSGSTGRPKLVPLTHHNLCCSATNVVDSLGLSSSDRCLVMWEQYHIGGLSDLLLAPLISGGQVVLTSGFRVQKFFQYLHQFQPTWYQAVPTALGEILFMAERNNGIPNHSGLRLIRSVAAPLSPQLHQRLENLFHIPVICTFGMTEASPLVASTRLPPFSQKYGSVGRPVGVDVLILGENDEELPAGGTGQIAIRGSNVFSGYENHEGIDKPLFKNGYFLTGDTGYFDHDGDLFLTGRLKDVANKGGEKISLPEIEGVLLSHPVVVEAAAFAVPHPTLGEDIVAAVTLRSPLPGGELRSFLVDRLSLFKVPSRIQVLDRLPRNPVGKIDKLSLIARVANDGSAGQEDMALPSTPIQKMIAEIWAEELQIDRIGVDEDFVGLGGDSLSAMRSFLTIETAVGRSLPDDVLSNFTTIREISGIIEKSDTPKRFKSLTNSSRRGSAVPSAKVAARLGMEGFEGNVDQLVEALGACSSRDQLLILSEQLITYSSPAEIKYVLEKVPFILPGKTLKSLRVPNFASINLRYLKWRYALLREVSGICADSRRGDWVRRVQSDAAILYGSPLAQPVQKTLVVGFAGNGLRLMQPTYRFLKYCSSSHHDLLLLRDPSRRRFSDGLDTIGRDILSVGEYVDRFARDQGYARVVAIGVSGGGPAAVCCALAFNWSRVSLVSPADMTRKSVYAGIRDVFVGLSSSASPLSPSIFVAYANNHADIKAAKFILASLPGAVSWMNPRFADHNIIGSMHGDGSLQEFISRCIGA